MDILGALVTDAKRKGATAAEAMLVEGTALSVGQRMGVRDDLVRSEGSQAGLRVFMGKRQAMASSTDLSPAALSWCQTPLGSRGCSVTRPFQTWSRATGSFHMMSASSRLSV